MRRSTILSLPLLLEFLGPPTWEVPALLTSDLDEKAHQGQVGNCNICSEQNILFISETKWYKIWLRPKG